MIASHRAVGILCLVAAQLHAQTPAPSVSLDFGIDTTVADVGNVVRLVRAYLAKPDSSALTRGLWSPSDTLYRVAGDIAASQAYQGFPASILAVVPDDSTSSAYVVKILHGSVSKSRTISVVALQRLYALR